MALAHPVTRTGVDPLTLPFRSPARGTVVQVLLNLGKGGMEAMAVNLALGMADEGVPTAIVALDEGGEHEETLRAAGIPYHLLGGRRFRDPRFHLHFARLLRRTDARVVHTHHFAPLLHALPATRLARVPRLVHTEHSEHYLRDRRDHRRMLRAMSRFTDAFVVVAHAMEPYYRDEVAVAGDRLRTVVNGVDTHRFRPHADRAAARRALGLPSGFLVGTAGRLFPEKDYAMLLRAAAPLLRTDPDARLVLIGDGPEREALEALAGELEVAGRVLFLGWRTDLPALVAALDVFALTSRREAFPLAVIEAMSAEVPVVATRVGDVPGVVEDGRNGLLVPVGDAAACLAALRRLHADAAERREMGRRARRRVVAGFGHDVVLREYLRLYRA